MAEDLAERRPRSRNGVDMVVVGAGVAGLYATHRARTAGLAVRGFEAGAGVGGTWFWNRYPGARCDVESVDYSFSFDSALQQEWTWSERFATQPEILAYLTHAAERFELREHYTFGERVVSLELDETTGTWLVATDAGTEVTARYVVLATGSLSVPYRPDLPGADDFAGAVLMTAQWPDRPVSFEGRRVGVIGTGSSGIQLVPELARQARELTVFQRTANYSIPAVGGPLPAEELAAVKEGYDERRARTRRGLYGDPARDPYPHHPRAVSEEERTRVLEEAWKVGGVFFARTFPDQMVDEATNRVASEFVRDKIRSIVSDPQTADDLVPVDHPIGAKRICTDAGYFATFNLDHVHLVNLRRDPIERVEAAGVRTASGLHELDVLVYATGFDAFTGALSRLEVRGRGGMRLGEAWADGPETYLGLTVPGLPNVFLLNGPGSTGALANMVLGSEMQVDWAFDLVAETERRGAATFDVSAAAASRWTDFVDETARRTLFVKARSWYLGSNVEGKRERFLPYAGGLGDYVDHCRAEVDAGYPCFEFAARTP
jgi:cation diffusion facilitator CzcD-associated flavoprotein CzcO